MINPFSFLPLPFLHDMPFSSCIYGVLLAFSEACMHWGVMVQMTLLGLPKAHKTGQTDFFPLFFFLHSIPIIYNIFYSRYILIKTSFISQQTRGWSQSSISVPLHITSLLPCLYGVPCRIKRYPYHIFHSLYHRPVNCQVC